MPLRQEFANAIETALKLRKRIAAGEKLHLPFLHQAIIGPPQSGKTFLADQYIKALQKSGLVNDKIIYAEPRFLHEIKRDIEQAKGGVLYVDDLRGLGSDQMRDNALPYIRDAIVKNECILVMLGSTSLMDDLMRDPGLMRRMNPPVVLTPEPETALPHPIHARKPLTFRARKDREEPA